VGQLDVAQFSRKSLKTILSPAANTVLEGLPVQLRAVVNVVFSSVVISAVRIDEPSEPPEYL
jgi:hypothetical protein